ncbi:MAG: hypothetical protein NT106_10840 [Candidatus Sumerlaeota bacterium]|nr:hypothetical protein [Candidatus Sumerlaeota bacterium]
MSRTCIIFITLLVAVLSLPVATEAADKSDFKDFKIVANRNIFDSERTPSQEGSPRPQAVPKDPPEEFRLVGVMISGKDSTAFFDGSRSDYKGQWKRGDIIAGFKIRIIRTSGLLLEKDSRRMVMTVASVMKKNDQNRWELSKSATHVSKPPEPASSSPQDVKGGAKGEVKGSEAGGGDILKKLMERRKKEVEK